MPSREQGVEPLREPVLKGADRPQEVLSVRAVSFVRQFRPPQSVPQEWQRLIREAIKIGYVKQALRLKKKIQRLIKASSLLLGAIAVAMAVLLEILDYRNNLNRNR